MSMPIKAFWSFNAQIDRLRCEENLEQIDLFVIANANASGEMYKTLREQLRNRIGSPSVYSEEEVMPTETDANQWREGFSKLQSILG